MICQHCQQHSVVVHVWPWEKPAVDPASAGTQEHSEYHLCAFCANDLFSAHWETEPPLICERVKVVRSEPVGQVAFRFVNRQMPGGPVVEWSVRESLMPEAVVGDSFLMTATAGGLSFMREEWSEIR